MDIVAATNNPGKVEELRRLFAGSGHNIISMHDAGILVQVEETGKSFAENAAMKAKAVCEAAGAPALGDDSGLCVDALGGAPGLHSARFAGNKQDDYANMKKLMRLLERTPFARRTARFECSLCLAAPDGATLTAEGACEGHIGLVQSSADGGFGYDPIFYHDKIAFAEMTPEEKDAVSHRGNAVRALRADKLDAFLVRHGG